MSWTLSKARKILTLALNLMIESGLVEDDEGGAEQPAPTPITAANGRGRKPATTKPAADVSGNAGAPPPAPPAAAESTKSLPTKLVCPVHRKVTDETKFKVIPAESSACEMCEAVHQKAGNGGSKPMSLAEVRAIAEELIGPKEEGSDAVWEILQSFNAESLTGAENSVALDPKHYEDFAKACIAAMPKAETKPAPPARRSL